VEDHGRRALTYDLASSDRVPWRRVGVSGVVPGTPAGQSWRLGVSAECALPWSVVAAGHSVQIDRLDLAGVAKGHHAGASGRQPAAPRVDLLARPAQLAVRGRPNLLDPADRPAGVGVDNQPEGLRERHQKIPRNGSVTPTFR
jgi:hypothetical protein